MSLFDRRTFLGLTLALGACGFTPVYGPGGTGGILQNRILVEAPTDRETYLLTQRIEERLGRPDAPQFGLAMDLRTTQEGLAIDPDGAITRYNLVGHVNYTLRDLSSGQIMASGKTHNFTGYSATGTTVEAQAAGRDARDRLMTILADQIITHLLASPDLAS